MLAAFDGTAMGVRSFGIVLLLLLAVVPCARAQQPAADEEGGATDADGFNELGIRMRAEVVFDGRVQTNRWSCAMVTVENIGEAIDGQLVLRGGVTDDTAEPLRYTRAIDVGRKARKRVFLYFETEGWAGEWTIELVGRGGRGALLAIAPMRTSTVEGEDVVVAVVGEDPMGLNVLREAWPGAVPGHPEVSQWERRRVHLSLATPEAMPDRWLGYNVVDVLVWTGPDPTGMSDDQLSALAHFVGNGGTLVVTVTDGWQLVRDSSLADLLPVTLEGAAEVDSIDPLLQALEIEGAPPIEGERILIADARAREDAQVRAASGEQVLWAVRPYGLGRTVFLGADPSMRPIKGSPSRDRFWRHVLWLPEPEGGQRDHISREDLLREQLAEGFVATSDSYWTGGPFALPAEHQISECVHDADDLGTAALGWSSGYYYGASPTDTWIQEVRKKLGDIPALQPLPMGWIVLFAAVYLLCIGPVDYFALRLIGRQEWTWVTFPLMIAVFFVAAVMGTTAAKGRKAIMTRIEVVDVFEPEGFWRGQSYVGIFSSQRTDLTLQSAETHSALEPMHYVPTTYWWGADQLDEGFMKRKGVQVGLGGGALAYRAETWTMAYMQSAWVDETSGHGHFGLRHDGGGRVTIVNESDVGLYSAVLVFSETGTRLLQASARRPDALGLLNRIVAQPGVWSGAGTSTSWGGGAYRTHHLGALLPGASVQVDLDQLATEATTVYPVAPEGALTRAHDHEDWNHFKEMPDFWDRRGHLDLTRMLMDGQLVLLGFSGTPVESFELKGLEPESEPRTLVRAVLGEDPRTTGEQPATTETAVQEIVVPPDMLPRITGALDRDVVQEVVRTHIDEIKGCYEQGLSYDGPHIRGKATARFVIDENGWITSSEVRDSSLGSYTVENCIQSTIWGWTFPAPAGGGTVVVEYPFIFEPG